MQGLHLSLETSNTNRLREEWLDQIRAEWYRVMRPLGTWLPWDLSEKMVLEEVEEEENYFQPALPLQWTHVRQCQVVPDRFALIEYCLPCKAICCEVGTDVGAFARRILQLSDPTELHIIDISLRNFRKEWFSTALEAGVVHLHEQDSVAGLSEFPDGYFDWIYIDGNHSYEGVKRDIQAAKNKIKSSGMLAFNDYMFWSHRELMCYGVIQAVNEFCLQEGWELIYLALSPEAVNDVVLRKLQPQSQAADT